MLELLQCRWRHSWESRHRHPNKPQVGAGFLNHQQYPPGHIFILLMVQKSCTSWYGRCSILYRVLYIPGGAGFLNHQQYPMKSHCWIDGFSDELPVKGGSRVFLVPNGGYQYHLRIQGWSSRSFQVDFWRKGIQLIRERCAFFRCFSKKGSKKEIPYISIVSMYNIFSYIFILLP